MTRKDSCSAPSGWMQPQTGPYILMGKVLAKKGETELAVRALQHALGMDPNNSVTHHLLGQAYRDMGRTKTPSEN